MSCNGIRLHGHALRLFSRFCNTPQSHLPRAVLDFQYKGYEYVGWLVGRSVGWLVGLLGGWVVGWMVGWLNGWIGGWSGGWLVGRLVGWVGLGCFGLI